MRGPDVGTPWRQANWHFLEKHISRLDPEAIILDVGAGRGDFASIFKLHHYISLDVYPYPEVDIVCDLTVINPFREASLDAIVLTNVLEHIYHTQTMLNTLAKLLKVGGVLLVSVPFLLKVHQAPYDFVRYTHYSLQRLGDEIGLAIEILEGYYDPIFLLGEGTNNIKWWVLPTLSKGRRLLSRVLLSGLQILSLLMERIIGKGYVIHPSKSLSPAPIGYQIVYRKP
ncbi:MAG: methyltransferase domain-containing protein [Chloroflexota bacterium]